MNFLLFHREFSFPSSADGLNKCLIIVKEISLIYSLDFEKKLAFHTVVVEAFENSIVHGNKGNRELFVIVKFSVNLNQIVIEIEDQGDGFDIINIPSPLTKENISKESGRGIFFIKNLSSSFITIGRGNIVRININR